MGAAGARSWTAFLPRLVRLVAADADPMIVERNPRMHLDRRHVALYAPVPSGLRTDAGLGNVRGVTLETDRRVVRGVALRRGMRIMMRSCSEAGRGTSENRRSSADRPAGTGPA